MIGRIQRGARAVLRVWDILSVMSAKSHKKRKKERGLRSHLIDLAATSTEYSKAEPTPLRTAALSSMRSWDAWHVVGSFVGFGNRLGLGTLLGDTDEA